MAQQAELKVERTPDGGAKITIPEGYLGECGCGSKAVHKVWMAFTNLEPALEAAGIVGVWHHVCQPCFDSGKNDTDGPA